MANPDVKKSGNWMVWAIGGGFLLLFFPTIFLGIHSFFYRDFGVLAFPVIHYQKECFLSGELPLWNPLSHCGIPFLAQWGTMTLYPPSLFYIFLPLPWSLNVFCLLHLLFGASGMYIFARDWMRNEVAALLSSIVFVFNGISLSCLMWPNYTAALCWMPWIIFAVDRAITAASKNIVFAIIFSTFQFMTGVPEMIVLTHIVNIGVIICRFTEQKAKLFNSILRYSLIVLSMLMLGAMQLIPFIDLLLKSHRTEPIDFTRWSMPGWGLANFFVPLFHYFKTYQNTYIQSEQAFFTSYYFPLGALALAIAGITCVDFKKRIFFLLLIFFSLTMASGSNSFIYKSIVSVIPMLDKIRYPVKFILLLTFVIPFLAGYGITGLLKNHRKMAKLLILVSSVFLIIIVLILIFNLKYPFPLDDLKETAINSVFRYINLIFFISCLLIYMRNTRISVPAFIIALFFLAADARYHIPRFQPMISAENFKMTLWEKSVEEKKPSFGEGRVFISPAAEEKLLRSVVADWTANFLGKRLALWSNLNLLEGIPKVNGAFTLQLLFQKKLEKALYNTNDVYRDSLLQFLNVAYITKPGTIVEWTKFTNSLPMIFGGQAIRTMESEEVLYHILSTNFNPPKEVIIDEKEIRNLDDISSLRETKVVITNAKYFNHCIEFEYESQLPSIITISQTYYDKWRAKIDGKDVRLIRVNYAFQGLIASPGKHRVVIVYTDKSFTAGLLFSMLGTIVLYLSVIFKSRLCN